MDFLGLNFSKAGDGGSVCMTKNRLRNALRAFVFTRRCLGSITLLHHESCPFSNQPIKVT